jgi:hypothetical protein
MGAIRRASKNAKFAFESNGLAFRGRMQGRPRYRKLLKGVDKISKSRNKIVRNLGRAAFRPHNGDQKLGATRYAKNAGDIDAEASQANFTAPEIR